MNHVDHIGFKAPIKSDQVFLYPRIKIFVKQLVRVILIEKNPVDRQAVVSVVYDRELGRSIGALLVANDLDLVSPFSQDTR
jgi:hypothetical protein